MVAESLTKEEEEKLWKEVEQECVRGPLSPLGLGSVDLHIEWLQQCERALEQKEVPQPMLDQKD